jgi:hypothetical protein
MYPKLLQEFLLRTTSTGALCLEIQPRNPLLLPSFMALGSSTGAFAKCGEKHTCKPKCKSKPLRLPKPKYQPQPVRPPKPCCEYVECPPIEDDCCERNICPPTGVITPRVDLIEGAGMDWFVTGDYTFSTAREDNIEFAVGTIVQGPGAVKGGGQGHVFRPGDKWVSGFKAGLGTDFCHDGWDLYAEYPWFKSTRQFFPHQREPICGQTYCGVDGRAEMGNRPFLRCLSSFDCGRMGRASVVWQNKFLRTRNNAVGTGAI